MKSFSLSDWLEPSLCYINGCSPEWPPCNTKYPCSGHHRGGAVASSSKINGFPGVLGMGPRAISWSPQGQFSEMAYLRDNLFDHLQILWSLRVDSPERRQGWFITVPSLPFLSLYTQWVLCIQLSGQPSGFLLLSLVLMLSQELLVLLYQLQSQGRSAT